MAPVEIPVSQYEHPRLNERFYKMDPSEYIDTRLRSLVLTVSDTVDHDLLWSQEINYRDMRMSGVVIDRAKLDQYATLESTVLLHHSCETMLRLYLAHAFRAECPWIQLSSLISAREFKLAIRELGRELDDPVRQADVLEVFSYASDPSGFPGLSEEAWTSHRDGLVRLLRVAIEEVGSAANAYNAAKHGLAVGPGETAISIGPAGGAPMFTMNGPSLSYLEMSNGKRGRHWQMTSRWVDPLRNMGLTFLVKERIKGLWNVARLFRGLSTEPPRLYPIELEHVESLLRQGRGSGGTSFSEHIAKPSERENDEA
ncbi:hypothetical protein [Agromyces sp. SYSU T0242]|uniref:hypothetical protein n=1 Tax=Agromyces litoreus TaxID=3158561 RepID=UPI0033934EEB